MHDATNEASKEMRTAAAEVHDYYKSVHGGHTAEPFK